MSTPTEFLRYGDLPTELKFQVVREATAELIAINSYCRHRECLYCHSCHKCGGTPTGPKHTFSLGPYACIDLVWQDVIEAKNFKSLYIKPDDIEEFGKTCRKRHIFLGQIDFYPYPDDKAEEIGDNAVSGLEDMNDELKDNLHALFNTMKDWSHEGRRLPGLINLHFNLTGLPFGPVLKKPISIDFSGLPTVNVIGSFQQPGGAGEGKTFMDPSSTIEFCRKLPNLNHISLDLSWQPTESGFLQQGTAALNSLRSLPYVPPKLSILCARHHGRPFQAELPALQILTSPDPQWSDTITELSLNCIKDVPRFIQQFQATSWPQLRSVDLHGDLKPTETASGTEVAGLITQGLIGALSKMRKLVTIRISVRSNGSLNTMSMEIEVNPERVRKGEMPFAPRLDNGFARIRAASIPGNLASQLQEVVWSHRRLVLGVFCMPPNIDWDEMYDEDEDDDDTWSWSTARDDTWAWNIDLPSPFHKCKKWNSQKNRWDLFATFLPVPRARRTWVLVGESDDNEPGDVNSGTLLWI